MSLELIATIICDICGKRASSEPETKFTRGASAAGMHKMKLERQGWITVSRGRYNKDAHCCPDCVDKPIPKLPGKKRFLGPIITDAIEQVMRPVFDMPVRGQYWVRPLKGNRLVLVWVCQISGSDLVKFIYQVRGSRKCLHEGDFIGWIDNGGLKAVVGYDPIEEFARS